MDDALQSVEPGTYRARLRFLRDRLRESLPGYGRPPIPDTGLSGQWELPRRPSASWLYGHAFRHPIFRDALRDACREHWRSPEEAERAAIAIRLAFAVALTTEDGGFIGVSPAVLGPILRVLVEEAEHLLPEEILRELRDHTHRVNEQADQRRREFCIPGTDEFLLPWEALGEREEPEPTWWSRGELLEAYLSRHGELERDRHRTPQNASPSVRTRPSELFTERHGPPSRKRTDRADGASIPSEAPGRRSSFVDAQLLARQALSAGLPVSERDRERLQAITESTGYRKAAASLRENPGSFHKAVQRVMGRFRRIIRQREACSRARSVAVTDAEHRAVALVHARDVLELPINVVTEKFGFPTKGAASTAVSRARGAVTELSAKADRDGSSA